MNLYNRIMEIFWFVAGFAVIAFATYLYLNDVQTEDLKVYYISGSMAMILSVFRVIYRKNVVEKGVENNTQHKK